MKGINGLEVKVLEASRDYVHIQPTLAYLSMLGIQLERSWIGRILIQVYVLESLKVQCRETFTDFQQALELWPREALDFFEQDLALGDMLGQSESSAEWWWLLLMIKL